MKMQYTSHVSSLVKKQYSHNFVDWNQKLIVHDLTVLLDREPYMSSHMNTLQVLLSAAPDTGHFVLNSSTFIHFMQPDYCNFILTGLLKFWMCQLHHPSIGQSASHHVLYEEDAPPSTYPLKKEVQHSPPVASLMGRHCTSTHRKYVLVSSDMSWHSAIIALCCSWSYAGALLVHIDESIMPMSRTFFCAYILLHLTLFSKHVPTAFVRY